MRTAGLTQSPRAARGRGGAPRRRAGCAREHSDGSELPVCGSLAARAAADAMPGCSARVPDGRSLVPSRKERLVRVDTLSSTSVFRAQGHHQPCATATVRFA